jgi:hypothetical protein
MSIYRSRVETVSSFVRRRLLCFSALVLKTGNSFIHSDDKMISRRVAFEVLDVYRTDHERGIKLCKYNRTLNANLNLMLNANLSIYLTISTII